MYFQCLIFIFHIFLIDMTVVSSETQSKTTATCGSPGIPGIPGVPGNSGENGSPGLPGTNGVKGEPGVKGERGVKGIPGKYGRPGSQGSVGAKGESGVPGRDGMPGLRGPVGVKGEPGEKESDYVNLSKSNWKQCVWNRADSKDTGLIQNCIFKKKYGNTSLRVFYAGNLRSLGTNVCSRWYFTFGGAECKRPTTIEGVVFARFNNNPLRHRQIEGYCNQLPKGQIRVGFWIGKCQGFSVAGDGHTGYKSKSRIVIEEVSSPQT